jgi:uncharacterized protein
MSKTFLKAEWRKLAMVNYAIDKKILAKYLPNNTEIDTWNGTSYVSLVGFMFLNTRVLGMKIPFHINFEEANLRFYVRHHNKRGVVFIKEVVPKPALAWAANTLYKEHYETMPMKHSWEIIDQSLEVEYRWKKEEWNTLRVSAEKQPVKIEAGSEEEYITVNHWGYTKVNAHKTYEYEVVHPIWEVYNTKSYSIGVDFGKLYGKNFSFLKNEIPKSVFIAEGSEIEVKTARLI